MHPTIHPFVWFGKQLCSVMHFLSTTEWIATFETSNWVMEDSLLPFLCLSFSLSLSPSIYLSPPLLSLCSPFYMQNKTLNDSDICCIQEIECYCQTMMLLNKTCIGVCMSVLSMSWLYQYMYVHLLVSTWFLIFESYFSSSWNRTRPRVLMQNQHTRELISTWNM